MSSSNCRTDPSQILESLASTLLADGTIDAAGLERAKRAAAQSRERLDQVLIKLGLVKETKLVAAMARTLDIKIVTASEIPVEPVLASLIAPRFLRSRRVLPLAADDTSLTLAVVDPLDREPAEALAYLLGKQVVTSIIAASDFDRAIQILYPFHERGGQNLDSRLGEASEVDVQRLRELANEAPVIRLVNQMIADASEAGASDIHVEPDVAEVVVRYRIDGRLERASTFPIGFRAAIISRLKIMAKLDIAERRLPQDGRIKIAIRGVDIDLRVSTIPTAFGESVVLRILDRSRVNLDFQALGFCEDDIACLTRLTAQPNGIVLVTGPTGSGKTTTLYTMLKGLDEVHSKIFTVEDPIEYQLPGITQVQVQPAIGLDFPHALRSILRQDPDIIMIGEIRDGETARIAIQAALTGHLVLSTLHTNSAAAAITRLLDMGTENYLLASTVNGILAQRLARRLCPDCAQPHTHVAHWVAEIKGQLTAHALTASTLPPRILSAAGCAACRNTGFHGRLAILELMPVDHRFKRLILDRADDAELEASARQAGMNTLYEDGLLKVWRGLTTIEEVLRITRAGG